MMRSPFDDPFVQDFCRIQIPGRQQASVQGVGQGFILSPDGYILTSAHLVQGASSVSVTLSDQSEFKAKVVGRDPRSDLALLKIVARAARSDGRRGADRPAAHSPGNRPPRIRANRSYSRQSPQFRRLASRSRRHGVPAGAIAKGKRERGVQ